MNRDESSRDDEVLTILLYASDRTTRQNVRLALGRKVAADLPPVRALEVATQAAVLTAMDAGGIDLAILDGWRPGRGPMVPYRIQSTQSDCLQRWRPCCGHGCPRPRLRAPPR
jgi:hypothetical protein